MRSVLQHHVVHRFENKTALGVLFSGGEWKEDLISVLSCREGYYLFDNTAVLNLSECPKRAANAIHLVLLAGSICCFIILMSDSVLWITLLSDQNRVETK